MKCATIIAPNVFLEEFTNMIDYSKTSLVDVYGANCFSDTVMKERLPKNVYKEVVAVQNGGTLLSKEAAEVVANAMKDWALEKGATHFTHWFQPLTGLTAEKHDAFISPVGDGSVVLEFSGKELIQGEPDASSFPNGGLRATFEARGYTAWDTASPAFIKESGGVKTLTIPTAFFSYTGEALDKKVPLLRSMVSINEAALKVLKLLGNTTATKISVNVGPEQEYFLIDEEFYNERPDLKLAGRTVFGSMSAKGQEMDDHYFGAIKERVNVFMKELNSELWKLGISAKTQHNEVAPNQFEIATIYASANISVDTNQLVMETLKTVARHHGMVALLHEKPFAGVNGSGKHNNWSISTDDGQNLLSPGASPAENVQFLLFLTSLIKAVDTYSVLLRLSAATSGNDHRLGANEAPPAIISMYLGDMLHEVLEAIAADKELVKKDGKVMELGLTTIPSFPLDDTDRNRTSPFAFTGNKFEFRMVGSSQSLADPNTMLNAAVAEILNEVSARLEAADDVLAEAKKIIKEFYAEHKRVVFNGNGYSEEWVAEAAKRGLPNMNNTVEVFSHFDDPEYVELLSKQKIFSKEEIESRKEIYLETYVKQINIEASLMVEMASGKIVPAANRYLSELIASINAQKEFGIKPTELEALAKELGGAINSTLANAKALDAQIKKGSEHEDEVLDHARFTYDNIVKAMATLRTSGDLVEKLTDKAYWPFPTFEDMLFTL